MMSRSMGFIVFLIYILVAFVILNSVFNFFTLSFLDSIGKWVVALGAVIIVWSGLRMWMTSMSMGY